MSAVGQKRSRDEINQNYLWHQRLSHIGEDRINRMKKDGIISSLNPKPYPTCESCLRGKMAKLPLVGYGKKAIELLALVHTDVCGSFDVQVKDGYDYFITFTDDLSRYGYVYR